MTLALTPMFALAIVKLTVTVFHVAAAGVLILFILLHAGRGGGLSEMFGGGMTGGSTLVEKNLDRLTVIVAVIFIVTTIWLHFLTRPPIVAG